MVMRRNEGFSPMNPEGRSSSLNRTVQELLGHKDIRMTMRHAHLAPDHMRRAVSILDGGAGQSGGSAQDILDSHYLDTKGLQNENQGAASQA